MLNIALRVLTLGLFAFRWWYWKKTEVQADREKPKTLVIHTIYRYSSRGMFLLMYYGMLAQVMGLKLVPFPRFSVGFSIVGVLLVVVGVGISVVARKQLGSNWTNGYEYQIKKDHSIVTNGIYGFIRHPIYSGLTLCFVGGEMVAQSYLWISAIAFMIAAYAQGKREERLLLAHFGDSYREYMHHTKMLIPFVL